MVVATTPDTPNMTTYPPPGDNSYSPLDAKSVESTSLDPESTNSTSLNSESTNLTFVDPESKILTSNDFPGGKNITKTSRTFQELMEKVSGYLVEGIQGVLIVMPELDVGSPGRQGR